MDAVPPPAAPDLDDPAQAARAARLRHVSDAQPGISRIGEPGSFSYRHPDGAPVTDEAVLARIRKLAVPPAYTDVWICRHANGHLQASGRDARGRKQHRYHPGWRAVRDEAKYARMLTFGRVLPAIRARTAANLARAGLPREKVLAAIVRLLETTLMRVGNEEYARANRSFGLTTLRNRHVKVAGAKLMFDFKGKHGIAHRIDLSDRRLAAIVRRCQDLPGQDLFQYLNEDGAPRGVGSDDVNAYLREASGEEVTAKDYRTWAATNLAALALREIEAQDAHKPSKANVLRAVEKVAKLLGNTPAICRKCYIHPAIFEGYLDGSLAEGLRSRAEEAAARTDGGLTAEEAAIAAFLGRRLEAAA